MYQIFDCCNKLRLFSAFVIERDTRDIGDIGAIRNIRNIGDVGGRGAWCDVVLSIRLFVYFGIFATEEV